MVCTRDRPGSLARALASVLAQDEPDFETLVVDGSAPALTADQLPALADPRVRLLSGVTAGVGAARDTGLRAARGELIGWCDDDDEWTTDHLRVLADVLRRAPDVDLVYGDSRWEQDGVVSPPPWSVDVDLVLLSHQNYIFASDALARTRAARSAGGFDPLLPAHEDWDLWLRMSRAGRLRHLRRPLATRHWTTGCLSADPDWNAYARVHHRARQRAAAEDDAEQHALLVDALPRAPFTEQSWSPARRELVWHSSLRANEGYGSAGRQLLQAVARRGVQVQLAPSRDQPPHGFEAFAEPPEHWGRVGFYYDPRVRPGALPAARVVSYSMWESTAVPDDHVAAINSASALHLVPCRANVSIFQAAGVQVPVRVLHHGVDASRFPLLERPTDRPVFTFGTFGDLSPRKGIDVLLRAFADEFGPEEPVRLLLKGTRQTPAYRAYDSSRVQLVERQVDQAGLLALLGEMDVFVLPSRGEGFGLCGIEAMSTGLPLIATDWSGPSEYLDPCDSYPLSYQMADARGQWSNHVHYHGQWAEPDYEHLRHLLRHTYQHRDQSREHGLHAAARVRRDWTWDRVAGDLVRHIDDLVARRP